MKPRTTDPSGPLEARGATRRQDLPMWTYRVVNAFPHDPGAFTQGLVFADGFLYESTGLNGRSTLRKVQLETGTVLEQIAMDRRHFAEGLAVWRQVLVQLTWRDGLAFVYDRATFRLLRTVTYPREAWGLTSDATGLIVSDGTAVLRVLDPESFQERRRITVRENGRGVMDLNELEAIRGEIYANVWRRDQIARIDPADGSVLGWIDLAGLLPEGLVTDPEAVLNGIAYDAEGDRLFVTGKLWPHLFEIKVGP